MNPGIDFGKGSKTGFDFKEMLDIVRARTKAVNDKLTDLGPGDQFDIAEMFEMQLLMNKLSQLTEMAGGVMAAAHSATQTMARNISK